MAPLNVGGCSRAKTRTFCPHFKTILGHFAAFSRSGLRLPGQAEQHSGVKSNSIPGTERRVSSSPSALSALNLPGGQDRLKPGRAHQSFLVSKMSYNASDQKYFGL